ncbi:MAG: hypothetical protein KatS3mg057_3091 [Herpetosiphonaceae bacterium]|nr:MAG: hypothetical protein KatS3mg057_3091 [Herpetosiphonaceae bacterium]
MRSSTPGTAHCLRRSIATEWGRSRGLIRDHHQRAVDGIERWLAEESWRIITVSQFMSQQLREVFHIPEHKIDVIHNAVQPPAIQLSSEERATMRRLYATDGERIVFTVGRMVYEKGFQILIEAIPRVLAAAPNTRFIIAGTGDLRPLLEQRAHELDVAGHIRFTGFISDAERDRIYQIADVAVFPSLYEPFGIVALEAMAARCPVVVSQTGGLQEVVSLHETGITVYPDNPDSACLGHSPYAPTS